MDLKWLLVRRITLVALACFVAGSAFALLSVARDAKRQNVELVEAASRQLELQLSRIDRSTDLPARFPDWELVSSYALQPGQCIEYRSDDLARHRSSCAGNDDRSGRSPRWFAEAHRWLLSNQLAEEMSLYYRGSKRGTIVAEFDAAAIAGRTWNTVVPLLTLSALLVGALCIMTYFVVDRALLPTQDIMTGLNRLAQGDLSLRLPPFRLSELNRISEVFNAVANELQRASSERAEFARRLVDMQEEERRHIARELHDDIAQQLAALNAQAACIRRCAQEDRKTLVVEARKLEKMTSGVMVSLRQTLAYLRPQEIDDLGLVQSLKSLVDRHNEKAHGNTAFRIEFAGDVSRLRAETNAHVYRIVQEALNNAAKHANARNVRVRLAQHFEKAENQIKLSVIDDGAGASAAPQLSVQNGMGLIGMRERVLALSGKYAAGPLPAGGFGLQVEFPISQRGA